MSASALDDDIVASDDDEVDQQQHLLPLTSPITITTNITNKNKDETTTIDPGWRSSPSGVNKRTILRNSKASFTTNSTTEDEITSSANSSGVIVVVPTVVQQQQQPSIRNGSTLSTITKPLNDTTTTILSTSSKDLNMIHNNSSNVMGSRKILTILGRMVGRHRSTQATSTSTQTSENGTGTDDWASTRNYTSEMLIMYKVLSDANSRMKLAESLAHFPGVGKVGWKNLIDFVGEVIELNFVGPTEKHVFSIVNAYIICDESIAEVLKPETRMKLWQKGITYNEANILLNKSKDEVLELMVNNNSVYLRAFLID
jgi:hypothetical protein